MKYLKKFKLFESINEEDIKLSELEPYLVEFKQIGITWTVSFSQSIDMNFPDGKLFISSGDLPYSEHDRIVEKVRTLDIELRPEDNFLGKMRISPEEFTEAFNLISDYLNSDYGLELNYIYISNDWSYLYFPSVENVIEHLDLASLGEVKRKEAKIIANRITLSFK